MLTCLQACQPLHSGRTLQESIGLSSQQQVTSVGEGDEGGGSVLRTGMARVTPLKVRLYSLRGRVSVPPCLLCLCCAASVHPSGGVGAGRKAHQSSSFSCVTIPRSCVCSCKASSCVLRMNAARGRLSSVPAHTTMVSSVAGRCARTVSPAVLSYCVK